jgi:hypothetical protein
MTIRRRALWALLRRRTLMKQRLSSGSVFVVTLALSAFLILALVVTLGGALAQNQTSLPNLFPFNDPTGNVETYATDSSGQIDLTGPFFQQLGTNGRTCNSCHQPSDGWTVSAADMQARFKASNGLDPIFRTNDGSNCDHNIDVSTVAGRAQAYSLLTSRGLIRIALSVPSGAEFTVVNVSNPYGCSEKSPLSMYRRPLPAANLNVLSTVMWDGRESSPQTGTLAITQQSDLLADLAHQSADATLGHGASDLRANEGSTTSRREFRNRTFRRAGGRFQSGLTRERGSDRRATSPIHANIFDRHQRPVRRFFFFEYL